MARRTTRTSHDRERAAQEAARLMVESGIRDYQQAKRKALERLRLDAGAMPRNDEVERAVGEYQRLYRADVQPGMLAELRLVALRVMRRLEHFEPRLTGPVLSGAVDEHSEVVVHLLVETPEEVEMFLLESRLRYDAGERRLRVAGGDGWLRAPSFSLLVDDVPVELLVFCGRSRRDVPLSPVDGTPLRRANLAAVEALAAEPA